jgi:hypothetical protein
VVKQVVRCMVRKIQSDSSNCAQRVCPRVQPRCQLLVLPLAIFAIKFGLCASLPAIILVCGIPREHLTFFRLGKWNYASVETTQRQESVEMIGRASACARSHSCEHPQETRGQCQVGETMERREVVHERNINWKSTRRSRVGEGG